MQEKNECFPSFTKSEEMTEVVCSFKELCLYWLLLNWICLKPLLCIRTIKGTNSESKKSNFILSYKEVCSCKCITVPHLRIYTVVVYTVQYACYCLWLNRFSFFQVIKHCIVYSYNKTVCIIAHNLHEYTYTHEDMPPLPPHPRSPS